MVVTAFLKTLLQRKIATIALLYLLALVAIAILAPMVSPYDPILMHYDHLSSSPSLTFLFGTDYAGRDILSRVIYGARVTIQVAVFAVILSAVGGITIGIMCGYLGGWFDMVVMRIIDIMFAIPSVLLALLIIGTFGPGLEKVVIAIAIISWPTYARLTRSATLSVKEEDYIESAKAISASNIRIYLHYIWPNIMPSLIAYTALRLGVAILTTATLGFLGLGAQPPKPEWGAMLSEARNFLTINLWMGLFPGLAIAITVLSLNIVGDALQDFLNPKTRKRAR